MGRPHAQCAVHAMNLFAHVAPATLDALAPNRIEILEPSAECCSVTSPPEGHVKIRNYRLVGDGLRTYTPTGDVNTTPAKGKLVARWEVCTAVSPTRAKILELVRPDQPGSEALEAIVRPTAHRGLACSLNDDARHYLQRTLLSPSPSGMSTTTTPEPVPCSSPSEPAGDEGELSLADELREAEEDAVLGNQARRDALKEFRRREGAHEAIERERLGRLALSVEQDDGEDSEDCIVLSVASRRLDTLLAESRDLHEELAEIHEDIQAEAARAGRCTAAARALNEESRTLRFLDDVLALLRGDLAGAVRARTWPFALGRREPERNYIV